MLLSVFSSVFLSCPYPPAVPPVPGTASAPTSPSSQSRCLPGTQERSTWWGHMATICPPPTSTQVSPCPAPARPLTGGVQVTPVCPRHRPRSTSSRCRGWRAMKGCLCTRDWGCRTAGPASETPPAGKSTARGEQLASRGHTRPSPVCQPRPSWATRATRSPGGPPCPPPTPPTPRARTRTTPRCGKTLSDSWQSLESPVSLNIKISLSNTGILKCVARMMWILNTMMKVSLSYSHKHTWCLQYRNCL